MRVSFKTLVAAALLLGGAAAVQPSPASAQPRRGMYPPAGDTYAPFARAQARNYYGNRYYGGYRGGYYRRPAYYGYRYGYPRRYYGRGYYGGAVTAGLLGGLAVGTLANPYYYGYGPGYYRPAYYGPRCVLERRRVINRYGNPVWRRIRVCY